MNTLSRVLLATVIGAVAAGVFLRLQHRFQTPATSSPSQPTTYDLFLESCSGVVPINDKNELIAFTNCMGRVRGLSDGHTMTAAFVDTVDRKVARDIRLWCEPKHTTDKQLFDAVTTWINQNQERAQELLKEQQLINASTAIVIAALHSTYPCK